MPHRDGVSVGRVFYVVLKPERPLVGVPILGQRVRIGEKPEIYVVIDVDRERHCADLMLTTGNHEIEKCVLFAVLREADEMHSAVKTKRGSGAAKESAGADREPAT